MISNSISDVNPVAFRYIVAVAGSPFLGIAVVHVRQAGEGPINGNDLCRMTRNRIMISAASKKSAVRRRKNGHLMESDRLYKTSKWVAQKASIGLSECELEDVDGADVEDVDGSDDW